jgi:hypothetical protein
LTGWPDCDHAVVANAPITAVAISARIKILFLITASSNY